MITIELAREVNRRLGKRNAEEVAEIVNETIDTIVDTMEKGQVVKIGRLGTFKADLKPPFYSALTKKTHGHKWVPKFKFSNTVKKRMAEKRTDYYDHEEGRTRAL